jgi:hypothetical protein
LLPTCTNFRRRLTMFIFNHQDDNITCNLASKCKSQKKKSKSGTTPYPNGASASAPRAGRTYITSALPVMESQPLTASNGMQCLVKKNNSGTAPHPRSASASVPQEVPQAGILLPFEHVTIAVVLVSCSVLFSSQAAGRDLASSEGMSRRWLHRPPVRLHLSQWARDLPHNRSSDAARNVLFRK